MVRTARCLLHCLVYPVAQWEYLCAGNRKCVECEVSFCTSTAIVRLVEERVHVSGKVVCVATNFPSVFR